MVKTLTDTLTRDQYRARVHERRDAYTWLGDELANGCFDVCPGDGDICSWCISGGVSGADYVITKREGNLALCRSCLRQLSRLLAALDNVDALDGAV